MQVLCADWLAHKSNFRCF